MRRSATVIIPDHQALGIGHQTPETMHFMAGIEEVCLDQGYRLMAIVNGPRPAELAEVIQIARERLIRAGFKDEQLVIPDPAQYATGIVGAVQVAYDRFLASTDADEVVVKMDQAEHPGQWIKTMVEAIQEGRTEAVCADLDFSSGQHTLGTSDQQANERLTQICQRLRLPFALTNAHGFQAYGRARFEPIYTLAKKLHAEAGRSLGGGPNRWGFDMSMILAAHLLNAQQQHLLIPAEWDRNRDGALDYDEIQKKVASQVERWEAVAEAVEQWQAAQSAS